MRGLRLALGLWVAVAASAVLLGTALAWEWRLAVLLCLAPAAAEVAGPGRRALPPLVRLQWAGDGSWHAVDAAGTARLLRLAPPSSVFGKLVVLAFREGRRRHRLVVTPGRVGERAFRALRLRLELDRHRLTEGSC